MRHLEKRHSWPPMSKGKPPSDAASIDADPFAYFVSPLEESYSDAGIGIRSRSHSLPPFCRRTRASLFTTKKAKSPAAKLKYWIKKMEKLYAHRSASAPPTPVIVVIEPRSPQARQESNPGGATRSPVSRGRGNTRQTSGQRVAANGRTPPRRPRVWREPSSDIWSVAEENEEIGLGITT